MSTGALAVFELEPFRLAMFQLEQDGPCDVKAIADGHALLLQTAASAGRAKASRPPLGGGPALGHARR